MPTRSAHACRPATSSTPGLLAAGQLGYLKQAVEWGATYLSNSYLPGDRFVGCIGDKRLEDDFWCAALATVKQTALGFCFQR